MTLQTQSEKSNLREDITIKWNQLKNEIYQDNLEQRNNLSSLITEIQLLLSKSLEIAKEKQLCLSDWDHYADINGYDFFNKEAAQKRRFIFANINEKYNGQIKNEVINEKKKKEEVSATVAFVNEINTKYEELKVYEQFGKALITIQEKQFTNLESRFDYKQDITELSATFINTKRKNQDIEFLFLLFLLESELNLFHQRIRNTKEQLTIFHTPNQTLIYSSLGQKQKEATQRNLFFHLQKQTIFEILKKKQVIKLEDLSHLLTTIKNISVVSTKKEKNQLTNTDLINYQYLIEQLQSLGLYHYVQGLMEFTYNDILMPEEHADSKHLR